jgi:outer membrane murein-binding lipoprotein Lpp
VEGKARSAANGRVRQTVARSIRQLRAEVAQLESLLGQMREARQLAEEMSR